MFGWRGVDIGCDSKVKREREGERKDAGKEGNVLRSCVNGWLAGWRGWGMDLITDEGQG